jgi:excisionase family DNA binding protein
VSENERISHLLTAREVAGTLGVSTETVLRWARHGDIPVIRLPGRAVRFREGELDSWLTERSHSSIPTATATR